MPCASIFPAYYAVTASSRVKQLLELPHQLVRLAAPLHLHKGSHVAARAVLALEAAGVLGADASVPSGLLERALCCTSSMHCVVTAACTWSAVFSTHLLCTCAAAAHAAYCRWLIAVPLLCCVCCSVQGTAEGWSVSRGGPGVAKCSWWAA
jgi:hypothetical protein